MAQPKTRTSRKAAASFQCQLVVMAKLPVAGRVKTRLAAEVGVAEATRFYRATARAVLGRLGRQPFWRTWIAVSPDRAVGSPMLPLPRAHVAQGGGDLGQRMQRPMRMLPPGPLCVVGTDVPAIGARDVRRAFQQIGQRDVVFGPAEDGGFWLVGMRRRPRVVWPYRDVAWSKPDTLARVLANLSALDVGFTTTLSDVDSAADKNRMRGAFGRVVRPVATDE